MKANQNARSHGALFAKPTPLNIIFGSDLARPALLRANFCVIPANTFDGMSGSLLNIEKRKTPPLDGPRSVKPARLQIRTDQPDHENPQRECITLDRTP
jgi:hypothetical protein